MRIDRIIVTIVDRMYTVNRAGTDVQNSHMYLCEWSRVVLFTVDHPH
jgi:hypothetical protein